MKKIIWCLLALIHFSVSAQNKADLIQMADDIYKFGDYKDALDIYKQVLAMDSSDAYVNLMAGKCYLETAYKGKSLLYLNKAFQLDNHACFNLPFLLAYAYQLNYDFDNAINYYSSYKTRLLRERIEDGLNEKDEMKKTDRRIFECNNGKTFVKAPTNVYIENMSESLNSEYGDYAPVISEDESILFFTSRRIGSTGGNKDNDNEFFEDIYFSRKENSKWIKAENAGTTVNTNLHESCIGISPNGKEIFIYKDNDKIKGDIFYCVLDKNNKWSKPKSMGKNINTEYIENSITISTDGKTLFFSSNRPGGFGGTDIYKCTLDKNGEWGVPVNLGEQINTEYDDESPFYYQLESTLYFSSKGHNGMGGFDLYKSKFDSKTNQWGAPENLVYPINSPDDDIYFVLSGNGKYGYYSSVKENCYGDIDLYKIHLQFEDTLAKKDTALVSETKVKPKNTELTSETKVKPKNTSVSIHLSVSSQKDKIPLDAKIRIFDLKSNKLLAEGKSKNGVYDIKINKGEEMNLVISAEKEGYVFKSEKVTFKPVEGEESTINKNLLLSQVTVGYRAVLRNIYFEFDKAILKKESKEELDRLVNFMKTNPGVLVVIEGHTDSKGSIEYNNTLSFQRSTAVVNYLIDKGVDRNRLVAKGLGELRPMASNDDEEEGRELNRRTEFLIKGKVK